MPTKNILRMLIVLQAALWIGQRVAAGLSIRSLNYDFGVRFAYITPLASLFGRRVDSLAFLCLYVGLLIAGISLCIFSNLARPLYLVVSMVAILAGLAHGPLVRSGSMDFFNSANILLTGVILTLIYSSPLKDRFEGRSRRPTPAYVTAEAATPLNRPLPPLQQCDAAERSASIPNVPEKRALFCGACGAASHGTKFCPECGKPIL